MQKIHINLLLPQLFWSFVSAMSQTHNINVNVDEWELQVHDVNALSTSIQPLLCSQLMTSSRQDIISPSHKKLITAEIFPQHHLAYAWHTALVCVNLPNSELCDPQSTSSVYGPSTGRTGLLGWVQRLSFGAKTSQHSDLGRQRARVVQ